MPSATAALELLCNPIEEGEGLTRSAAIERLTDGTFEFPDARKLVVQLLLKGYSYAIDD